MHDQLRNHAEEKVFEKALGEPEAGPIVPPLHDLQTVSVEVDLAIEEHLLEGPHGDFGVSVVFDAILLLVERQVMFDRLSRKLGLLVLARCEYRGNNKVGSKQRDVLHNTEEDPCF